VSGAAGTNGVRAVTLHEVGHMLGLWSLGDPGCDMWPFLSEDVQSVRLPTPDDVAWCRASTRASRRRRRPSAHRRHGDERRDGLPILGAHVYVVDPATQASVVGGYTRDDGGY